MATEVQRVRLRQRHPEPVGVLRAEVGRVTVAEVEELVEVGAMAPAQIHTPGIFVQHVVVGRHEKRIERRTTRPNIV